MPAVEPEVVYWDTCVFIALLQKQTQRFEDCNHLLERAQNGEIRIVTSAITLTECTGPSKPPRSDQQKEVDSAAIIAFFENEYINVRQADRAVAVRAHQLRMQHGSIKPLDAIHLATALLSFVSVFQTYDGCGGGKKGLLRWNRKLGSPKMRIEIPPSAPPPPSTITDLFEGCDQNEPVPDDAKTTEPLKIFVDEAAISHAGEVSRRDIDLDK